MMGEHQGSGEARPAQQRLPLLRRESDATYSRINSSWRRMHCCRVPSVGNPHSLSRLRSALSFNTLYVTLGFFVIELPLELLRSAWHFSAAFKQRSLFHPRAGSTRERE